jgi:UDP-glucose 4-epimerase
MILLTGATGYIGSHTWLELLLAGHKVIGVDNFANSSPKVLSRIEALSGKKPEFVEGDVCDKVFLGTIFRKYSITGVVHFAALKAVGESSDNPLMYYENNLGGLIKLLQVMKEHDCLNFVFSSSACVYGDPDEVPVKESSALRPENPYGQTKLMSEQVLRDLENSNPNWRIAYLRYFNPIGAHESGLIGEDPLGIPNNLSPIVARVASGRMKELNVYGDDWETPDGTGVRDYIHVVDLAQGHVKAVDHLLSGKPSLTLNLGTGVGYSVLDVIKAYEEAVGKPIPYKISNRRPGDVAVYYADPSLAQALLGWRAQRDLRQMCADSWRWQSRNPMGYESK